MTADFLSEIMEARKKQNIFQVLKEKNCHPVKIPLTNECEIKALSDEEKLRENLFARFPLRKKKKNAKDSSSNREMVPERNNRNKEKQQKW